MKTVPSGLEASLKWMNLGTKLLLDAADSVDDDGLKQPSALPSWSRQALLAHVASNADALHNLIRWAATGEPRMMYASPQARSAAIERGAAMTQADLLAWLHSSAEQLEASMASLTADQWLTKVKTAQGRVVPATEVPWLRSREVLVHAVDLRCGLSFADLPDGFLEALSDEIRAKRAAAHEDVVDVQGSLADSTAYLAGRPHGPLTTDGGLPVPVLGPWL